MSQPHTRMICGLEFDTNGPGRWYRRVEFQGSAAILKVQRRKSFYPRGKRFSAELCTPEGAPLYLQSRPCWGPTEGHALLRVLLPLFTLHAALDLLTEPTVRRVIRAGADPRGAVPSVGANAQRAQPPVEGA